MAAEHVVAALERAGAFHRPEIGDFFKHADDLGVAFRVGADGARIGGVEIAASRAAPDVLRDGFEGAVLQPSCIAPATRTISDSEWRTVGGNRNLR